MIETRAYTVHVYRSEIHTKDIPSIKRTVVKTVIIISGFLRLIGSASKFIALMLVSSLMFSLITFIYTATPASAQGISYSQGDIFAATANGTVIEYTPLGQAVQTLSTGSFGEETGMCFDSQEELLTKLDTVLLNIKENYVHVRNEWGKPKREKDSKKI